MPLFRRLSVVSAFLSAISPVDDVDQKLIALLRQDARLSVADLSHKLGVSRGTVTNRIRKLEDQQVIVGYTVKLRPDAQPDRIRAWMGVLVEGNQTRAAQFLGMNRNTLRKKIKEYGIK